MLSARQGISENRVRAPKKTTKERCATTAEKWGIPHGTARRARDENQRAREITIEKEREHGSRDQFGKLTEKMCKEIGRVSNQRRKNNPSATR